MISLEELYFDWLLGRINRDGVEEGVAYVCDLLHDFTFQRRVGNDVNRAIDGQKLREEFLRDFEEVGFSAHVTNDFMMQDCSWLEMLVALSLHLDYLYDGGVEDQFIELITNMGFGRLTIFDPDLVNDKRDRLFVEEVTSDIDNNRFDRDGHGGIFPLYKNDHPDQREVEIWDQHAAYFREKLEGVLWISSR